MMFKAKPEVVIFVEAEDKKEADLKVFNVLNAAALILSPVARFMITPNSLGSSELVEEGN